MKDVIIIGAGLTGLTTALYLKRGGLSPLLIEEREKVGGQIESFTKNGYIYEKGPNTGIISSPEVVELFNDLEAIEILEIAKPSAKCRLIWRKGKFHPLPSSLLTAITTPLFTFSDKFRILFEPFRKKGTNPMESLANITCRRLGRSFLYYAVDPFISGIYAGDPTKLITKYAMPKLYNLEQKYGSFVRGAIAKSKEPKSDRDKLATKEVFSVKGGLSRLIERLANNIGSQNTILSAKNVKIQKQDDGLWLVSFVKDGVEQKEVAKSVVTTVGAFRLEELFSTCPIKELSTITSLKYSPVTQVSVAVQGQNLNKFNAFGGLVPSKEKQDILGILFPSSCFHNRAPQNSLLLSIFIGGYRMQDVCDKSNNEIIQLIEDSLASMLKIKKEDVSVLEIFRHPKAIPQYEETQGAIIDAISVIESSWNGLYLGGAIHGGIGMSDRIKQGKDMAKKILNC